MIRARVCFAVTLDEILENRQFRTKKHDFGANFVDKRIIKNRKLYWKSIQCFENNYRCPKNYFQFCSSKLFFCNAHETGDNQFHGSSEMRLLREAEKRNHDLGVTAHDENVI